MQYTRAARKFLRPRGERNSKLWGTDNIQDFKTHAKDIQGQHNGMPTKCHGDMSHTCSAAHHVDISERSMAPVDVAEVTEHIHGFRALLPVYFNRGWI
eukprot:1370123-Amorphochlora_amoeboformis.AAC.1